MEQLSLGIFHTQKPITALEYARRVKGISMTQLTQSVNLSASVIVDALRNGPGDDVTGLKLCNALESPRRFALTKQRRRDWATWLTEGYQVFPDEPITLLRYYRRLHELNQIDTSKMAGISRPTLSLADQGQACGGQVALALHKTFGLPAEPLLECLLRTDWPVYLAERLPVSTWPTWMTEAQEEQHKEDRHAVA